MTEREKKIKGLEIARKLAWNGEHCNIMDADDALIVSYAITDALALLTAQEPDETRLVHHYSRPNVYADLWLHCEKCGGVVDDRYRPTFCPNCGRKVKWK